MIKTIAVYCSSSDALAPEYFQAAEEVGKFIGENNYKLVWGGANLGLMGKVAETTQKYGGKVLGVVPKVIEKEKIIYTKADEMIKTEDMYERKKIMFGKSDAFINLAGGFGTLEEAAEILTLKQLKTHTKPVVFINTKNFYDNLVAFFEIMYQEKVSKPEARRMYYIAKDAADAFSYLRSYLPTELPRKWFDKVEEVKVEAEASVDENKE